MYIKTITRALKLRAAKGETAPPIIYIPVALLYTNKIAVHTLQFFSACNDVQYLEGEKNFFRSNIFVAVISQKDLAVSPKWIPTLKKHFQQTMYLKRGMVMTLVNVWIQSLFRSFLLPFNKAL